MAAVRSLSPINPNNPSDLGFPPGLAVELAMGLNPIREVCEGYGVTREDLEALVENPIFKAEYESALDTRVKEGGLFSLKARLMAEDALETQYKMMQDAETPPAVRLKASENILLYAGKVPKNGVADAGGPTFAININMAQATPNPTALKDVGPSTLTLNHDN